MSKGLAVAAFVLLVLSGAMGLKNIAAATSSASATPVIWANGPGPIPTPGGGGK